MKKGTIDAKETGLELSGVQWGILQHRRGSYGHDRLITTRVENFAAQAHMPRTPDASSVGNFIVQARKLQSRPTAFGPSGVFHSTGMEIPITTEPSVTKPKML